MPEELYICKDFRYVKFFSIPIQINIPPKEFTNPCDGQYEYQNSFPFSFP